MEKNLRKFHLLFMLTYKINICHTDPEKLSITKINSRTPSGYSLLTHCSFDATKNKHDYDIGKDCMKNLSKDPRKHATKIIDYEKMIPLTNKENKSYHKQKVCYICEKNSINYDDKKYYKVKDHCYFTGKYRGTAHNICNLRYKSTKEIPVVFHNGSTYDYHFIIKELAKRFEGQFECSGENAE